MGRGEAPPLFLPGDNPCAFRKNPFTKEARPMQRAPLRAESVDKRRVLALNQLIEKRLLRAMTLVAR